MCVAVCGRRGHRGSWVGQRDRRGGHDATGVGPARSPRDGTRASAALRVLGDNSEVHGRIDGEEGQEEAGKEGLI